MSVRPTYSMHVSVRPETNNNNRMFKPLSRCESLVLERFYAKWQMRNCEPGITALVRIYFVWIFEHEKMDTVT